MLDFGHILAGPYCARLLADLGADVVKIESRRRVEGMGRIRLGDSYKGRRDRSPHMLMTNRNRRSVTLDLKTLAGAETAARLAAVADVIVENFSAGALDRVGLGYSDLAAKNPRLIYLSLSGYGHEGPRRDWTSMNLNLQAYSGLMMTTGAEGDPPTTIAVSWNDYIGALHGCAAVLNALYERQSTGRGARLDLSQFECSVSSLGALLLASSANRSVPPREANRSELVAPQGVYRCAGQDEWCVISIQTDEQWRSLAALIGGPSMSDSPFGGLDGRRQHHDEIDRLLEAWTASRGSLDVETRCKAAGIPAERMSRTRDVLADASAQGLFPPVEDPPGHTQLVAALPFKFGRSSAAEPGRSPEVGEDTAQVLAEWLGLAPSEVEALETAGALV